MMGEFTWFNSFLFFGVAVLISYLVTSTPRTSGARLVMFAVLAIDWIVERMIFGATDTSEQVRILFNNVVFQGINVPRVPEKSRPQNIPTNVALCNKGL